MHIALRMHNPTLHTKAELVKRYTVTAALPYANGPVHIGHLAGVYVPADIYVRYLRSLGKPVLFLCGSDEHGVPITLRARKEGISPQEVVDKYNAVIRDSFAEFGISFDIYSRTSNAVHKQVASDFFEKLYNEGKLEEQTTEQFFDEKANLFLADRYIQGTCPNCGNPNAYGDQCERCGTSLSPAELINPHSMLSGEKPIMRPTKHWFLPLDQYEPWLKEWILSTHTEWKNNVYGQCKSWLDQGLHPRAVTRDLDWGVPVPLPGSEGKVLYVWFDAPIGYISAAVEWAEKNNTDWRPWWQDPNTRLLHFIGKDNIVFHCIIFPAMLKAHGEFILPDNVPANEFLNLEGNKISTSRNWAVWLNEYLTDFPGKQDVLRYVLCATAPETKDNDFTWKDFQARNNNELVAIFGNFVNRALVLTHKYFNGKVPPLVKGTENDTPLNVYTGADSSNLSGGPESVLTEKVASSPKIIAESIESFRFREALAHLMDLARSGNKYLAETEPWKLAATDLPRAGSILNYALQTAANLAILCEPFLPHTALKLRNMLNFQTSSHWLAAGTLNLLPEGMQLGTPELLFGKVEDSEIAAQIDKLTASREANVVAEELSVNTHTKVPEATAELSAAPSAALAEALQAVQAFPEAQKAPVTFDEFVKMDIRVATVLEAEAVPKSKKLLKLKLDTGIDIRTVMSGIAEYFKPEELPGRQVCILANLAPRAIMGVTSQGMILMAHNADGGLAFVQPNAAVTNGGVIN